MSGQPFSISGDREREEKGKTAAGTEKKTDPSELIVVTSRVVGLHRLDGSFY